SYPHPLLRPSRSSSRLMSSLTQQAVGAHDSVCDWSGSVAGVNPDVVPHNPQTRLKVTYGQQAEVRAQRAKGREERTHRDGLMVEMDGIDVRMIVVCLHV